MPTQVGERVASSNAPHPPFAVLAYLRHSSVSLAKFLRLVDLCSGQSHRFLGIVNARPKSNHTTLRSIAPSDPWDSGSPFVGEGDGISGVHTM